MKRTPWVSIESVRGVKTKKKDKKVITARGNPTLTISTVLVGQSNPKRVEQSQHAFLQVPCISTDQFSNAALLVLTLSVF